MEVREPLKARQPGWDCPPQMEGGGRSVWPDPSVLSWERGAQPWHVGRGGGLHLSSPRRGARGLSLSLGAAVSRAERGEAGLAASGGEGMCWAGHGARPGRQVCAGSSLVSHQPQAGQVCAPEPPGGGALSLETLLPDVAQVQLQVHPHPTAREVPWTQAQGPGPGLRGWRVLACSGGRGLDPLSSPHQPPLPASAGTVLGCDCEQHMCGSLLHRWSGHATAVSSGRGRSSQWGSAAICFHSPPVLAETPPPPRRWGSNSGPRLTQSAVLTPGPSCLSRGCCSAPYGHQSPRAGRAWVGRACGERGVLGPEQTRRPPGLPAATAEGLLPLSRLGLSGPGGLGRE